MYDPLTRNETDDPQQHFSALRRSCPVHHRVLSDTEVEALAQHPLVAAPTHEFWSLLRHEDIVRAALDTDTFSNGDGPGPERLVKLNADGMLLTADPPQHNRQRRIANKAFSPKAVAALLPGIQEAVDDLIDEIASRGRAELLADFSVPLTVRVIANIVGIERERCDDLKNWGFATVAALGGGPQAAGPALVAIQELSLCLTPKIEAIRARANGAEDNSSVLATLVTAESDGSRLDDIEILMICQQLLTAGFETGSIAVASGVYLLCSHPSERTKLEQDPGLLDGFVEETLRYMAPVEGLFRTTKTPVTVRGQSIPADAKVRLVWASANHDEDVFDDPGSFRIDRDPAELRRHVAFGMGQHFCLGAALARAELRSALGSLFRRLPGLMLDPGGSPERNTALTVNGFRSLPVCWDPARVHPRQGEWSQR